MWLRMYVYISQIIGPKFILRSLSMMWVDMYPNCECGGTYEIQRGGSVCPDCGDEYRDDSDDGDELIDHGIDSGYGEVVEKLEE